MTNFLKAMILCLILLLAFSGGAFACGPNSRCIVEMLSPEEQAEQLKAVVKEYRRQVAVYAAQLPPENRICGGIDFTKPKNVTPLNAQIVDVRDKANALFVLDDSAQKLILMGDGKTLTFSSCGVEDFLPFASNNCQHRDFTMVRLSWKDEMTGAFPKTKFDVFMKKDGTPLIASCIDP